MYEPLLAQARCPRRESPWGFPVEEDEDREGGALREDGMPRVLPTDPHMLFELTFLNLVFLLEYERDGIDKRSVSVASFGIYCRSIVVGARPGEL